MVTLATDNLLGANTANNKTRRITRGDQKVLGLT